MKTEPTTAHTPGPWSTIAPQHENDQWLIHRRDGGYKSLIARVSCEDMYGHGGSEEANAILIAAAPELLEAVTNAAILLAHVPAFGDTIGTEVTKAQCGIVLQELLLVIAKATT